MQTTVAFSCDGPRPGSGPVDAEALNWLCQVSPYAMLLVDAQGVVMRANQHACLLFGYAPEAMNGTPIEMLVPKVSRLKHENERRAEMVQPEQDRMRGGKDLIGQHRDGHRIPVEVTLVPVSLAQGPAVIATIIDLRAHKELEAQLREERDLSEAIIHSLPAVFYVLNRAGRFLRWNQNLEQVTGMTGEELAQHCAWDLFDPVDTERVRELIEAVFVEGKAEIDLDLRTRTGGCIPYHFTGRRVELANQLCLTGAGIDISTRKALEADLKHQATHDPLTGLINRQHFEDLLRQELERAQRYRTPFSLVMMDIDHFKAVNDGYGHLIGDMVLRVFAEALRGHLRSTDTLARWGGEEFMVLSPDTRRDGAVTLAEAVRLRVAETPMPGPGRVTVSLAVTAYQAGESAHELLKRVDDALYEAKRTGRNRVVVC
jgi:diguanylate cyclase (GGDEF)-like protein/PAS domain S-box-containing protein